jgi:hypothetical protein
MRQAAEGALHSAGDEPIGVEQLATNISPGMKRWMKVRKEGRSRLTRRDRRQADRGMPQENFDKLNSGVARAAQNCNVDHMPDRRNLFRA